MHGSQNEPSWHVQGRVLFVEVDFGKMEKNLTKPADRVRIRNSSTHSDSMDPSIEYLRMSLPQQNAVSVVLQCFRLFRAR